MPGSIELLRRRTHAWQLRLASTALAELAATFCAPRLAIQEIDFVAVNDLTSPATLAHLLKYDSILGNLTNEINAGDDFISVDGKKIKVYAEKDPAKLPWADSGRADRRRVHRPLHRRRPRPRRTLAPP